MAVGYGQRSITPPDLGDLVGCSDPGELIAVVLFGSVARGDQVARSDLDVLVVVNDHEARKALLGRVRADADSSVCPLVLTRKSFLSEAKVRPSFACHLLDEGVTLHGSPRWTAIRASLAASAGDNEALDRELRLRVRLLDPLARTERFRNSPITALSHIYGIARSLVIVRLLQSGIHEYGWQRAFDRYADVRPELRSDLESLKSLRPYYEYARSRTHNRPSTRDVGTEEVRSLVASARRLAA